jgi:hypothetical protein
MSYIDEAEEPGTYYYFLLASDERRQRFVILAPQDNSISVKIESSGGELFPGDMSATADAGDTDALTGISAIRAAVEGDGVVINFRADGKDKLVLYRSIRPLNRTQDLLGAVIVQPDTSSPFLDYPVPGIPYYYALVSEEDLIRGTMNIIPGQNATTEAVEIPSDRTLSAGLRGLPLPLISPSGAVPGMDSYSETPGHTELSPEAAWALEDIPLSSRKNTPGKRAFVFREDIESPRMGEEYALASIVQGSFANNDWGTARDELTRYLALPRSKTIEARAHFYLGQCYYFSHSPQEALFEFLEARSFYPTEAAEWIQASLSLMGG